MPRSNTAAKKAARRRSQATGEPYMVALRATAHPDLLLTFMSTPGGPQPFPAVVTSDGWLHSYEEWGPIIGFQSDVDDQSTLVPWRRGDDPQLLVGRHLVTSNPFTDVWSTWVATVADVGTPGPVESRPHLLGGLRASDDEREARRERVRRQRRGEFGRDLGEGVEPRVWQLTCLTMTVDVDEYGQVTNEDGRRVGWCEMFFETDAAPLMFCEFAAHPSVVLGAMPVVWATDRDLVPMGQVLDIELVFDN